jgi:hypothetical protein
MDSKRTRGRMRRTHAVRGDPSGASARGRCAPWMERGAASRLDRSPCCPAVRSLPHMSGPMDSKRTRGRMRRTHAVRGDPRGVAARQVRTLDGAGSGIPPRPVRLLPGGPFTAADERTRGRETDRWRGARLQARHVVVCGGPQHRVRGQAGGASALDERAGRAGGTSGREDRRARGGEGRDEGTWRRTRRAGGTTAA